VTAECVAHAGTAAERTCAFCGSPRCGACLTYEVDGEPACEACGSGMAERSRAIGSGVIGVVAVGYLATLAVGVGLFHARPFVSGVAAIVAITVARALQLLLRAPAVLTRRSGDR
jgi:uncharacterized protein (DUF983 family)